MAVARKAKITLISVEQYGTSPGVRLLSAILKRAGYETRVIFVQGAVSRTVVMGRARVFSDSIHDEITELAADSLYVGLSVITPTYHAAKELTLQIKSRITSPVIWGGIHATAKPDECLEQADMVCVGEGEALVVDLADRLRKHRAYNDIPGLRLRDDLPVVPAPQSDLSQLPNPKLITGYWVQSISLR